MRKVILSALVLAATILFFVRFRLFVRDPLAGVQHNGAKEAGAQVYINFANDVLIENDKPPMYVLLLQHGGRVGPPASLHCLHWLFCLTDADQATLAGSSWDATIDEMTGHDLRFHSKATESVVTLY